MTQAKGMLSVMGYERIKLEMYDWKIWTLVLWLHVSGLQQHIFKHWKIKKYFSIMWYCRLQKNIRAHFRVFYFSKFLSYSSQKFWQKSHFWWVCRKFWRKMNISKKKKPHPIPRMPLHPNIFFSEMFIFWSKFATDPGLNIFFTKVWLF